MKAVRIVAVVVAMSLLASALTSPQIVASGSLIAQSTPFTQTLFTPTKTGLFRVILYAENTTGNWPALPSASISFTSAHGADTASCNLQGGNLTAHCDTTIRDLAGDSISAFVNSNVSLTIDFYFVVERIQ